ncbi:hypothetical protein AB0M72_27320 [Nocardiopsis dassonvillei]
MTPHKQTRGAARAAEVVGLALILPPQPHDPDDAIACMQQVLRESLRTPARGDSPSCARAADPAQGVGRGGARTP